MTATDLSDLSFYLSRPHDCSYLVDRVAATLFVNPEATIDTHNYTILSRYGFRRSGCLVYRPRCPNCNECIPVRVAVADFQLRRVQRRIWRNNQDVIVRSMEPIHEPEHFALYQRYMESRHPGGGMHDPDPKRYMQFLTCPNVETAFHEFRIGDHLMAIAVTDYLDDALSAVYTFFDPALARRSPGVYAILWQIEQAKSFGFSWLYLGYLIQDCKKMAYKEDYQPLEQFRQGRWQRAD